MRVAYLLTWAGDQRTGVYKKIIDQVSMWSSLGVEPGLFVATSPESAPHWASIPHTIELKRYSNILESFRVQRTLVDSIVKWDPDITYVRTTVRQFLARGILDRLRHVIEIQNDDLAEAKGLSTPRLLLAQATRARRLSAAHGMVFVSNELMSSPTYEMFTRRRIMIANGINLSGFDPLPQPSGFGDPQLVFIGMPNTPWHGLDDVLALAKIRPKWHFDLIGPQTGSLSAPENVRCHGELTFHEYQPILREADAAISTLALYSNGMSEASPLKSREYLALGLAVIGGYRDSDLSPTAACYLQLPNEQGAVIRNVGLIEDFIAYWRGRSGRRVPRDSISHLDSKIKESARLNFLSEWTT